MTEPKIRFKADDGSSFPGWERKTVTDIFDKIRTKNKDCRNTNVITNSAEFGLIKQREFFDKDIAVEDKTENYTVIQEGDFVYNPRKSTSAPFGPFNCYRLLEDGIVSPLYTCLRPKGLVSSEYLLWYFKTDRWHGYIKDNGAQNGARHDRVGMTDAMMMGIPVSVPCDEEQQKIADFLSNVDEVITASEEEVVNLEQQKKAVMQKIFSQEVRFKKEDGSDFPDWEEKKLGSLCSLVTKGTTPKVYVEDGEVNFVRIDSINNGKIDIDKCLKIDIGTHTKTFARSVLKENDVLCSIAGALGVIAIVTKDVLPANTNQALAILRLNDGENVFYVIAALKSFVMAAYIRACKTVGAQPNLSLAQMNAFVIPYPHPDEQQLIADFLTSYDEAIAAAKQELAKWKELKKGLLQQMFV